MQSETTASTIAAIATPPGSGGIGIIRISGSSSLSILQSIFSPHTTPCNYTSHRLYYGHILAGKRVVDEVLAVFMQAPRSYTCEDVVEVHCHGNIIVLESVLMLAIEAGARLADPGEFTKRAFLHGRIDLTQAEAVIDVLSAKTRKGSEIAQKQLAGALYQKVEPIRQTLLRLRASIEVAIDFPDEEQEIIDSRHIFEQLRGEVMEPLETLLQQGKWGKFYRNGVSLVIAGIPNVGKSSLLNALLQEDRALVTDIPGTTRDSIEEIVDIGGIPVRIADTAGIRGAAEKVEQLGIDRTKELIERADVVLFVIDGTRKWSMEDTALLAMLSGKEVLVAVNKCDCEVIMEMPETIRANGAQDREIISISAHTREGIETLQERIFHTITRENQWEEESCSPNIRHLNALKKAAAATASLCNMLEMRVSLDLLAVDVQECLDALGDITGENTTEDVLDIVFQEFCLGK